MKKSWALSFFCVALLALTLSILPSPTASAQTSADAYAKITKAFAALMDAESSGGDVGMIIDRLNEAFVLVAQGESLEHSNPQLAQQLYRQAEDMASKAILQASSARAAGILVQQNKMVFLVSELISLAALSLAIYKFVPRLFWSLWLHAHREWRLRKLD